MIWKKSAYGGGAIFGGGGKVNIESWRCAHTLRGHGGDVLDLAWSPNDALLATASVDNTVIVWNGERLPEVGYFDELPGKLVLCHTEWGKAGLYLDLDILMDHA